MSFDVIIKIIFCVLQDKVHMLEAENEKLRHDEDSEDIISPTPNISFG